MHRLEYNNGNDDIGQKAYCSSWTALWPHLYG